MRIANQKVRLTGPVLLICAALLTTAALLISSSTDANGQQAQSPIIATVPVSAVSAGGVSLAPKGATGDLFEESYEPTGPGPIRRQDLLGVGTYQAHGIFLGTVNLSGGQIVYAGSTTDQDNNTYAVLGGTGKYVGARGELTTKALSRTHVRITIQLS